MIAGAIAFACSSDPEEGPGGTTCKAGETKACTGANNCTGTQTCNADLKSFGACTCSSGEAGPQDVFVPDNFVPEQDAGPWNPRKIAGIVLWLDGSLGVVKDALQADKVAKWQDRSGKGNDVIAEAADGGKNEPVYDATVINGKGAVRCENDAYLTLPSKDDFKFGTGDYGVIAVAKVAVNVTTGPSLFEKGIAVGTTAARDFELRTPQGTGSGTATLADAAIDGAFAIYVARGSQLEVQAGGKKATGPKTTIDVNDNAPMRICRGSGTAFTSIAEMIVVKGPLTDADIAEANTFLKAKYGL